MKKYILSILALSVSAQAAVSITSSAVVDIRSNMNVVSPETTKLLLVVSNTGSTFSNILAGDSLTVGSTIGSSGDTILAVGTAVDFGGVTGAQVNRNNFDLTPAIQTGSSYALYWFSTLVSSDNTAAEGVSYGIARGADWIIPADFTSTDGSNLQSGPYLEGFTVMAVPEPSSVALLGLGALALVARRRRN